MSRLPDEIRKRIKVAKVKTAKPVTPLQRKYSPVDIYVATDREVISESGVIMTHRQAIESMPWPQVNHNQVVATLNVVPYLKRVIKHWEPFGHYFNVKAQAYFRESYAKGSKQKRIAGVRPCYFGFRTEPNQEHSRYAQVHTIFDPIAFLSDSASAVTGLYEVCCDPHNLLELAQQYRALCKSLDVPFAPSAGSFGAMMLRHPDFFPTARKKVPRRINKLAAPAKVGQLEWRASSRTKRTIVHTVDQRRAHHRCAADMIFPHSDDLRPMGNFKTLKGQWTDANDLPGYGLIYAKVTIPERTPRGIPQFPELVEPGSFNTWIATNELRDWQECGATIEHAIAAILSPTPDKGLNRYASFCLDTLDPRWKRPPHVDTFLKMIFFRAYGLLGMNPVMGERYYLRARRPGSPGKEESPGQGKVMDQHLGQGLVVPMHTYTDKYAREPGFVNQVWRAMLEREARRKVVMEARRLHFAGERVLGIFADSIFVAWPYKIELEADTWKSHLQDVTFLDRGHYEHSNGRLIAPGLTGPQRGRVECQAKQTKLKIT